MVSRHNPANWGPSWNMQPKPVVEDITSQDAQLLQNIAHMASERSREPGDMWDRGAKLVDALSRLTPPKQDDARDSTVGAEPGCLTDVVAMSASTESNRVLQLHYNRPITDADRARLVLTHNSAASLVSARADGIREGVKWAQEAVLATPIAQADVSSAIGQQNADYDAIRALINKGGV